MMRDAAEQYAKALAFATQKHSGQFRIGGAPYITHPVAVARLLREDGFGQDYQIAALFHDLLEDTDATETEIAAYSNSEVLAAVVLLTKQKGYDMGEYVSKICANPMAKAVKSADRLHNLQSCLVVSQEFKRKYILETIDWYLNFSPEIHKAVKAVAQTLTQPMVELSFLYDPVKNKLTEGTTEREEKTMENEFSIERAMQAATVEALVALAHENGVMLPLENAEELYATLHAPMGELTAEALDAVSGGSAVSVPSCPKCRATQINILWKNNKIVYACSNLKCGFAWEPGKL